MPSLTFLAKVIQLEVHAPRHEFLCADVPVGVQTVNVWSIHYVPAPMLLDSEISIRVAFNRRQLGDCPVHPQSEICCSILATM